MNRVIKMLVEHQIRARVGTLSRNTYYKYKREMFEQLAWIVKCRMKENDGEMEYSDVQTRLRLPNKP